MYDKDVAKKLKVEQGTYRTDEDPNVQRQGANICSDLN